MKRLRVAHVMVQPVLVVDDDESVMPGPLTESVQVPLTQLAGHAEKISGDLVRLQAELDRQESENSERSDTV